MSPNAPHKSSTNVAVVVVAVVLCFTLASAVAVFALAPEGSNTVPLVGSLLGTLAPTIAAVAVLVQVKAVSVTQAQQGERLDRVASDTHALTNGLLDSKVRAGVSEVIHPDLLHPDAAEVIAHDKEVRYDHGGDHPEITSGDRAAGDPLNGHDT